MTLTFEEAFERLIGVERGFSRDPNDPGNWTGGRKGVGVLKGTKYGISAATYGDLDIEHLTIAEAQAIYERDWWLKSGADVLDGAIVFQMWDFAVNAGIGNARRCLQRAVGVADDGVVGPRTLAAARAMPVADVLLKFTAAKIRHYTSLSIWPTQGRGWMNRTATMLDHAATDTR